MSPQSPVAVNPDELEWFTPQASRFPPQVTINGKGVVSFGKYARTLLPTYVGIAFSAISQKLYIKEAPQATGFRVSPTPHHYPPLSRALKNAGLPFPVTFILEEKTAMWEGTLKQQLERFLLRKITRIKKKDIHLARACPEMGELINLCRPKVKHVLYTTAKSIPIEDRKALVAEALIEAIISYNENFYEFDSYIAEEVRLYLKKRNPDYSLRYQESGSLDCRFNREGEEFSLHQLLADANLPPVHRLLEQQEFLQRLSFKEQTLLERMDAGYSEAEVLEQCQIPASKYRRVIIGILAKYDPDAE